MYHTIHPLIQLLGFVSQGDVSGDDRNGRQHDHGGKKLDSGL